MQDVDHSKDEEQYMTLLGMPELAGEAGLTLIELPQGLTTAQRVEWASARLHEDRKSVV